MSNDLEQRVIAVGLTQFDPDPLWWIGYHEYHPDFAGCTMEEAESASAFGDFFESNTCIETHPLDDVVIAIDRAYKIAKEQKLPLYRYTQFQEGGGGGHCVYEELYWPPGDI